MKQIITLIGLLLAAVFTFGQKNPIDFEAEGHGADWTWTVFENDDNPALEIVSNPDMSGVNTSSTVAKFTARQSGEPWAGCESLHGSDIGTFSINETNATIKIMVWKPVISNIGIKLVKPDGWSMGEIKVANTLVNQWEELSIDFSSQVQEGYDQIVIFPDFDLEGRTQDNVIYFDNITFSAHGGGGGTVPETAAPAPTHNPQNVISMFSDAYTNVTVDSWRTDWSDGAYQEVSIADNPTIKYSALNFVGIETVGENLIDATGMSHFHLDMWTPDANDFKVKLVDFGADAAYGGGDDTEHEITFTAPATKTWISYDIPLSDFTNLSNRDHIAQLIFVKAPLGTVYLDNIYYHNQTVGLQDLNRNNQAQVNPVYPNPLSHSAQLKIDLNQPEILEVSVLDVAGRKIKILTNRLFNPGSHIINWDATDENAGVYFIIIKAGSYQEVQRCIVK